MRQSRHCPPRGSTGRKAYALFLTLTVGVGCAGEVDQPGADLPGAAGNTGSSGSSSGPTAGTGPVVGTAGTDSTAGNGGMGGPGGGGMTSGSRCTGEPNDATPSVLRRLSGLEYQLTLQDLFQLPSPPSLEGIPEDTGKDGFKTFSAVQTVSAQHLRAYLDKARSLSGALLADSARRSQVLGCEPNASGCLQTFVTGFGKLAFRRPLQSTEVDALVSAAEEHGLDQSDRFAYVIEALLTSPNFLYRVEVGDSAEGLSTLDPFELASRLSFSLWGRTPSVELLDQAAEGALSSPQGLSQVAATMLTDTRAQQFFAAFFRQWLNFDALRVPAPAPMGWSDALHPAMQEETDGMLREYAWTGKNFLEVLTANHTRASRELGTFFGWPAPDSNGIIEFPAGHVRANTGLLTHPSLLSAKTDGDLIAIRGNWVRRTFFCEHIEIPATLAEDLGELLVGLTRVQIVQRRNTEAACASCHALIDPIGVGFDQFDALGRFDPSLDISEYGVTPGLPGAPDPGFSSIAELSAKLRDFPRVSECLAAKTFLYMNGREPGGADGCTVEAASQAFIGTRLNFPVLLQGLVEAPAFRMRRAPTAAP